MRRNIRLAPQHRERIAAVQHILMQNARRTVGMTGQGNDLRIEAQLPQHAGIAVAEIRVRIIMRAVPDRAADALHHIARAVFRQGRLHRLRQIMLPQTAIPFMQQQLCALLLQLRRVPVVIDMRMCQKDIPHIECAEPIRHCAPCLRQSGVDQQVTLRAVQHIAGDIGLCKI